MENSWNYVFEFLWEPCLHLFSDFVKHIFLCRKVFLFSRDLNRDCTLIIMQNLGHSHLDLNSNR